MKVYCPCGKQVGVQKLYTARGHYVPPGFPVWRACCPSCGTWVCRRGHDTDGEGLWLGKVRVCLQGDCGLFHEAWFKLWRKATGPGGRTPRLAPEFRARLAEAAQGAGAKGEAVIEFLDYFRWEDQVLLEDLIRD